MRFIPIALVVILLRPPQAEACGCFTPPDPSVPIVQAGERILFAVKDGQVTSHVQIQYSGDARDFGWLLPLPSVPTLELGTDELFTQLYAATQPQYKLSVQYEPGCFSGGGGAGGGSAYGGTGGGNFGGVAAVCDDLLLALASTTSSAILFK